MQRTTSICCFFFFQAEDGIRDDLVTGVQTCALPIYLSYIGDSELGQNVNIGAGTITANYNHFTKQKQRTIIYDGVSIGSNSVIVAPAEIGEQASIGAGTIVTKNVPPKSLALTRSPLKILKDYVEKYFKK